MSTENNTVNAAVAQNKLMSIGRAWVNDRENAAGTSPKLTIKLDQTLGINIVVGANTNILLFANEKRTELNPTTGQPYQDADYRVAIELPADVVEREIARQKAASEARKAQAGTVAHVA